MSRLQKTLAVFVTIAVGGCVTRAGQLPPPTAWPLGSGGSRSASVSVSGAIYSGNDKTLNDPDFDMRKEETLRAYGESGLFAEVRAAPSPADYRISVDILENGHTNQVMLAFTILTLGLAPTITSVEFVETTVIRDRTDKEVFRTTKQEGMSAVIELFALFWLSSGRSMPRQIVYDLSRVTLADAVAKGVFN